MHEAAAETAEEKVEDDEVGVASSPYRALEGLGSHRKNLAFTELRSHWQVLCRRTCSDFRFRCIDRGDY